MADEGIGPVAIETLAHQFDFPPEVELLDVATTGLAMLSYLKGQDHIIIIDAAKDSGHEPGTVIFYAPEDLANQQVMHSAHDQRLTDVLYAAALSGIELKSVVIVGVQIAVMAEWILELSEPVQAAVPVACAAALHCLRELGYEATPKPDADTTAIIEALNDYAPEN
jgi:hydrogenase maturation protease